MEIDVFWNLVDAARTGAEDDLEFLDRLGVALAALPATEIAAFDKRLHEVHTSSYGWPLWGAAYLINGGCSDDAFEYFRAWLISQGRARFEAAVANPDSLADLDVDDEAELEDFMHVSRNVYAEAAGADLPPSPGTFFGQARPELGEGWDFDDSGEMARRYPRLAAKLA